MRAMEGRNTEQIFHVLLVSNRGDSLTRSHAIALSPTARVDR